MSSRKYGSKKTTTKEGKTEYQREYMKAYRDERKISGDVEELTRVLIDILALERKNIEKCKQLGIPPHIPSFPGSIQERWVLEAQGVKVPERKRFREIAHPRLTPLQQRVARIFFDKHAKDLRRFDVEDMVRGHAHQNKDELLWNLEFLENTDIELSYLVVEHEQEALGSEVWEEFADRIEEVTEDIQIPNEYHMDPGKYAKEIKEIKKSFLEGLENLWLDIMRFLADKGVNYGLARDVTDSFVFKDTRWGQPYRFFNPVTTVQMYESLHNPKFLRVDWVKNWRKRDENDTRIHDATILDYHTWTQRRTKFVEETARPLMTGYIRKGWSDIKIEMKLRQLTSNYLLIRDSMDEAKRLREAGVGPDKVITVSVSRSQESLDEDWLECMAHKSGKPGVDGRVTDAEPFDSAVESCAFQVFRHTGQQPSPSAFKKSKVFWMPGYWLKRPAVQSEESKIWGRTKHD